MLPDADSAYLVERQIPFQVTTDQGMLNIVLPGFELPDALARRHEPGGPSLSCDHRGEPCDAAELAAELARVRAWADFASDLIDAHIGGFGSGDWQAGEALAHALVGDDWPPAWSRDPEEPAQIVVDPALWPTAGAGGETGDQG